MAKDVGTRVIPALASDPGSPSSGQMWVNTTSNLLSYYSGSALRALPTAGGTMSGSIAMGSHAITGVSDPSNPQDAATKNYVDATIEGLQIKPTATVATTAALPTNTYNNGASGIGATLTGVATGTLTVDGHVVALNDLVLVKNEVASANNGLYTCSTAGAGGVAYILIRSIDMNVAADFPGAFVPVGSTGTTNANSLWLANPSGAVTVGTTAIPFTQLNGATDLIPGTGISISGNTISVSASYAGQTSITAVGTLTAGALGSGFTTVAIAQGGSGQTSAAAAFNAFSPMTTLGDIIYGGSSGAGTRLAGNITSGQTFLAQTGTGSNSAAPGWVSLGTIPNGAIGISIDGEGNPITTGVKGYLVIPYSCTLNSYSIVADQSGSIVIDVWKVASGSALPTVSNTITASALPTLSSQSTVQNQALTGWVTSVAAYDIFGFNVNSASNVTKCTLSLKITKS